jgi:uncharacterized protein YdhG (YjbR/CyaY superfamily)
MTATKKATKRTTAIFSDVEKAAMQETINERKAAARRGDDEAEGLNELLAKIAEMPKADRVLAERIHAIVTVSAPTLRAKTWYGMPAWARDGKLVCFFKAADKFKARYATLGFEDAALLDDGDMWPTSYAVTKLTTADEAKIGALVKKAAG